MKAKELLLLALALFTLLPVYGQSVGSLTVEAGSKLSVSGGILDGVILKLLPGGEVTLSNNGTIIHSKSQPFTVPKGAILHQNSGVIR